MERTDERLDTMKREIDALQVAVMGSSKPWYRNFPLLVSVTALLFSFGTTFVSYRRTEEQDIQSRRQELRGLLQRLTALPKEGVENSKKYATDPAAMATVGGFINQENALLARQAAELAKRLPSRAVSAVEFYAVALALQGSYDLAGASDFLDRAIATADDFNVEISALRTKANLQFSRGHPDEGRAEYRKALDIFTKYPGYDAYTRTSTNVYTELSWASSEASLYGPRSDAPQHVENAERLIGSLPPSPGSLMLVSQVMQARTMLAPSPFGPSVAAPTFIGSGPAAVGAGPATTANSPPSP